MKKRTRKTKLAITIILIVGLLLSTQSVIHADDYQISVTVHGVEIVFEGQQPVIVDNRTLVPVRGVFEALGFYVEWDAVDRRVILTRENDTMILTIGSRTFEFNETRGLTLDVAPQIIGDSTMLPLRFPVQRVGYVVNWDQETRTVAVMDTYAAGRLTLETHPFNVQALRQTNHTPREISDILGKEMLRLINVKRVENGRHELTWSDDLAEIAFGHSVDMQENNFLEFRGSDGLTTTDRMRQIGIGRNRTTAEQVGISAVNPEIAFASLLEQEGFRRDILSTSLFNAGIGVSPVGYFGFAYWTKLYSSR